MIDDRTGCVVRDSIPNDILELAGRNTSGFTSFLPQDEDLKLLVLGKPAPYRIQVRVE